MLGKFKALYTAQVQERNQYEQAVKIVVAASALKVMIAISQQTAFYQKR
jgi:hypothetical protein